MRSNAVVGFLLALIGLVFSAGIVWAGLALWSPEFAGVQTLPAFVAALPFEQRWWAAALVLLGGAGVASVFPSPVWTQPRRRPKPSTALAPFAAPEPPPPLAESAPAKPAEPSPPALQSLSEVRPSEAALEAPHPDPFDSALIESAPEVSVGAACAAAEVLRQGGHADEALERYHAVLSTAREHYQVAPDDPSAASDLADVLKGIGDLEDEAGRLAPAIDAYEEGLALRRKLAAEHPSTDRRRALSVALERLADAREARGHRSQALALYEESLPIAESLAAAEPDDGVLAADLATTRQRLEALKAWMATA